jgi:lauroyl/myristoyl acyltransferase
METFLYLFARALVAVAQYLPLRSLARLGRSAGALTWHFDRRHRQVALENLAASFPEKPTDEIRAIAKENFRRLGETYLSILKTGGMDAEAISKTLKIEGYPQLEKILQANPDERILLAVGHFGNFELFAWMKLAVPSGQVVTTYRGLRQRKLTQLMRDLRKASGCLYFERRNEGTQLKETMKRPSILLGLLADQHAGDSGLRLPVFGREASVSAAPAVMAKRYGCRLFPSACFRTSLGRWKLELGKEIPLRKNGKRRTTEAITRDIITAQEDYIRRDPANWFWVHNRWKPRPKSK